MHIEFYFIKFLRASLLYALTSAASIDGVGKISLQAKILPPGRIDCFYQSLQLKYKEFFVKFL